jgi:maltose alpha-D-glucosyltransferase/alpha-amylase
MDRTSFPPVGELPYLLTLLGYGFYWFQLSKDAKPPAWHEERAPREDLPMLVIFDGWTSFFPDRVPPWRTALATKLREQLETRVIPNAPR